jgi:TRAP-type C4-dicarboxylate transport system substrate-binding protein
MPLLVSALVLYLVKRARPMTVALAMYEAWRRLPPEHRQRLLEAAKRSAPRVASTLVRRGRPRF